MKLLSCYLDGYRNLTNVKIKPHAQMNLIYGENAQGKTNFMEGISLFSGETPQRLSSESRRIGFDKEYASLEIYFEDHERENQAKIKLGQKNQFQLNRVSLKSMHEFSGIFPTIFFSPSHLCIVQGQPKLRRQFLDRAIVQLRSDYGRYLRRYERILTQRNSLLKRIGELSLDQLDVWDQQLAQLGTILSIFRQDYVNKMSPVLQKLYAGISRGKERLTVNYLSTVYQKLEDERYTKEKATEYFKKLEQSREKDLAVGYTSVGVHRDDLILKIDDAGVREYGSQGQQRSCVIALKLAEAALLKGIIKSEPIILLDDVMSELDESRQDYILHHVKKHQVFLTCCDPSPLLRLQRGKIFQMENGNCTEISF